MATETEQSLKARFFELDNEAHELKSKDNRNGWEKDRLSEIETEKFAISEKLRKLTNQK